MERRLSLAALLLVSTPAAAQVVAPPSPDAYARQVAAGYKAATLCSAMYIGGRTREAVEATELKGIYPQYDALVPPMGAATDRRSGTVVVDPDAGNALDTLPPRIARWQKDKGCTLLPIGAGGDEGDPVGPVAGADPRAWPMGDAGIAPRPARALADRVAAAFDGRTYGAGTTVGVVVLKDGKIVAERYGTEFGPFTVNRTWSVAKSIAGTLAGLAGVDPTAAPPIANWQAADDPRRRIRTDDLLRMASGLHSDTAGNRTDAIYFGGTAVDEQAPGWPLEAKPGTRFRYANNDILLAMLSLRETLGSRYDGYPTAALFAPLGMTHTIAERDWRGNYVISSQVWSTARDLARLGQFWLQDGVWQGRRMLPTGWLRYMTTPSGPQPATGPGYGATMWLFGAAQGLPEGSYAAQGNRGQYVMVVPSAKLVVVRRGEDAGAARFDIARFAADIAAALP